GGLCPGGGDRREHVGRLPRPVPPDAVAHAGREPSHGRPPPRLPGHQLPRGHPRRLRGSAVLPREASAPLPGPGERRPAVVLPVVGGARLRVTGWTTDGFGPLSHHWPPSSVPAIQAMSTNCLRNNHKKFT